MAAPSGGGSGSGGSSSGSGGGSSSGGTWKGHITKTVSLYVTNAAVGATNAALAYTFTTKGRITSILWQAKLTTGGAASSCRAELSSVPIYGSESNDAQGIISACATTASGAAGALQGFSFNHVGFASEIAVGDRVYINLANSTAPSAAAWTCLLTIQA